MKKLHYFIFIMLFCVYGAAAQTLIGKVTDVDSARTPLFMAEVAQMQNGKTIATYKTYFDGTYRIKVKPDQTYLLKFSSPGRSDTTVSISIDKHGTLYTGTLFVSLPKDGLRITGFLLDQVQDLPIRDASIILRNVMTRKETKFITGADGSYNLKMDYETNYTLRIDKMSPGILNKYEDTSFSISTIGFNLPLDFRLDIRLGPTNGYTRPRPEYDPHAKPVNKDLKPVIEVLGKRDSVRRREQDSAMATLNLKLHHKDSVIAYLDKRINDINTAKVALKDSGPVQLKKDNDTAKMAEEVRNRKQQLEAEQKRKDLVKAEADLLAKQQAEKDLHDRLDKEIKESFTRIREQQRREASKKQKRKAEAARAKAEQDSLQLIATLRDKETAAHLRHTQDSLVMVSSQKPQPKNDGVVAETVVKKKDTISAQPPQEAYLDSLVKVAEAKNKQIMARRKLVLDSLIKIENQKQAGAETAKAESARTSKQKEREAKELAAKQRREKKERDAQDKEQAEIAEKEKQTHELAVAKLAVQARDSAAAARKAQLERDLQAMKKSREDAEAKVLAEKQEKEKADKISKKQTRRKAKELAEQTKKEELAAAEIQKQTDEQLRIKAKKERAENEQRELEARKALEVQEKTQLTQQLGKLQQDQQAAATHDQQTKQQESSPSQVLKEEKARALTNNQTKVAQENMRRTDAGVTYQQAPFQCSRQTRQGQRLCQKWSDRGPDTPMCLSISAGSIV